MRGVSNSALQAAATLCAATLERGGEYRDDEVAAKVVAVAYAIDVELERRAKAVS
jgi:hypothetical protein